MKFISKILLLISCFMIMSSMLIPNYVHAADSPDSVMNGADKFINKGESASAINEGELKDTSNFFIGASGTCVPQRTILTGW